MLPRIKITSGSTRTCPRPSRASIAIAGFSLQKDHGIDPVILGCIFSAFGWAYVAGQIPGGWLKVIYSPRQHPMSLLAKTPKSSVAYH